MKQSRAWIFGIGLVITLAGCASIVRNVIGSQPAPNALQLDGLRVVAASGPATGPPVPGAATVFTASGGVPFPDIDWAAVRRESPIPLVPPRSYREMLGIDPADIILITAGQELPETVTLEGFMLELTFSNASGEPAVTFAEGSESLDEPVELFRAEAAEAGSRFEAAPGAADRLRNLVELVLDGARFQEFFTEILTNEAPQANQLDQNRLEAQLTLWLAGPDGNLTDSLFVFTVVTQDGTLDWRR
jgi:hypothetical protein